MNPRKFQGQEEQHNKNRFLEIIGIKKKREIFFSFFQIFARYSLERRKILHLSELDFVTKQYTVIIGPYFLFDLRNYPKEFTLLVIRIRIL